VLSPLVPSLHDVSKPLESFVAALIGMVAGAGILWGVGLIGKLIFRKDAMGMGDVKLLGGLGALLGWQAVLFTIMISAMLGSCVGIALILSRDKEWRSRIPYGPYLALAAVIWILWGKQWWDMYFAWVVGGTL
jgi:leader peptidase (prepilin peptidase)/N-methyltransferase